MEPRRFLITIAIVMFLLLTAVTWVMPTTTDFRGDNPFWNGIRNMSSMIPVTPLDSLSLLPTSPEGAALILIPYLEFTLPELEELHRFVTRGGTLVLADDYGFGNQVLERMGLKARFAGQVLLDPVFNYKNKWFPRIFHLSLSPITLNSDNLVLNHATSLLNVASNEVRGRSSSFSFLDLNGNEGWDTDEPSGLLPVISEHNLGQGKIILIADPSIFINSMQARGGNNTLIQNIAAAKSRLFFDQSHLPKSNLLQTKSLLVTLRNSLSQPSGTLALVIAALAISLTPIWHKTRVKHSG